MVELPGLVFSIFHKFFKLFLFFQLHSLTCESEYLERECVHLSQKRNIGRERERTDITILNLLQSLRSCLDLIFVLKRAFVLTGHYWWTTFFEDLLLLASCRLRVLGFILPQSLISCILNEKLLIPCYETYLY